jgi:hypothetical protein
MRKPVNIATHCFRDHDAASTVAHRAIRWRRTTAIAATVSPHSALVIHNETQGRPRTTSVTKRSEIDIKQRGGNGKRKKNLTGRGSTEEQRKDDIQSG